MSSPIRAIYSDFCLIKLNTFNAFFCQGESPGRPRLANCAFMKMQFTKMYIIIFENGSIVQICYEILPFLDKRPDGMTLAGFKGQVG
jgi:hypothetical protein